MSALRVQLADDDVVLVCQLVVTADRIIRGSVQRACAECGRQIWKAPGPALAELHSDGRATPASVLAPEPTVMLCTPCADIHIRVRTGRGLGLP